VVADVVRVVNLGVQQLHIQVDSFLFRIWGNALQVLRRRPATCPGPIRPDCGGRSAR